MPKLRIVILSGATGSPLPLAVLGRSRPGSGRQQGPSPWLVTFNVSRVSSDVEDSELSMPDLARENEDRDSEDEDHPDHESR